jgi:hypothetical protein
MMNKIMKITAALVLALALPISFAHANFNGGGNFNSTPSAVANGASITSPTITNPTINGGTINSITALSTASGGPRPFAAAPFVAARFFPVGPLGIAYTSTNANVSANNTMYCSRGVSGAPFTTNTAVLRTSSSNASNGAAVKICIYDDNGTGGTPSTFLGGEEDGTAITNAAVSTDVPITLDATTSIPYGDYYVCALTNAPTTQARYAVPAAGNAYLWTYGATTSTNAFGTAPPIGFTLSQTYASNCPKPFSGGTILLYSSSIVAPGILLVVN